MMHNCPECGQACDCDGEDTWIGWPYNRDCTHECEEEWQEDDGDDDYDWRYETDGEQTSFIQSVFYLIKGVLQDLTPFRCDMCGRWTISKHRPCCSQKCKEEWVPF